MPFYKTLYEISSIGLILQEFYVKEVWEDIIVASFFEQLYSYKS